MVGFSLVSSYYELLRSRYDRDVAAQMFLSVGARDSRYGVVAICDDESSSRSLEEHEHPNISEEHTAAIRKP